MVLDYYLVKTQGRRAFETEPLLTTQEEEIGMKPRLGLILAATALLSGTGCAAGGGGESQGPAAVPTLSGAGGQVLAEGIRPRDNSHTRAAEGFLPLHRTPAWVVGEASPSL